VSTIVSSRLSFGVGSLGLLEPLVNDPPIREMFWSERSKFCCADEREKYCDASARLCAIRDS